MNKKTSDFYNEFLFDNEGLARLVKRNIKNTIKEEMQTLLELYKEDWNWLTQEEEQEVFEAILHHVLFELAPRLDY